MTAKAACFARLLWCMHGVPYIAQIHESTTILNKKVVMHASKIRTLQGPSRMQQPGTGCMPAYALRKALSNMGRCIPTARCHGAHTAK